MKFSLKNFLSLNVFCNRKYSHQGHHQRCVGGMGMAPSQPPQLRCDGFEFTFLRKKNALRDFAAFHFTSTNKRTKKPFWREKCVYVCICVCVCGGAKKEPLKNLGEIKRVGKGSGGQEGTQRELKNQSDSTTDNERII